MYSLYSSRHPGVSARCDPGTEPIRRGQPSHPAGNARGHASPSRDGDAIPPRDRATEHGITQLHLEVLTEPETPERGQRTAEDHPASIGFEAGVAALAKPLLAGRQLGEH